jgi:hypothetical protein
MDNNLEDPQDPIEAAVRKELAAAPPRRPSRRSGSLPEIPSSSSSSSSPSRSPFSLSQLDPIKQSFREEFGRDLPFSVYGQGAAHNRNRWDHRNAADIGQSLLRGKEGSWLEQQLRAAGIPFRRFDNPKPRYNSNGQMVSSGPHWHIGYPSSSTRQKFPVGSQQASPARAVEIDDDELERLVDAELGSSGIKVPAKQEKSTSPAPTLAPTQSRKTISSAPPRVEEPPPGWTMDQIRPYVQQKGSVPEGYYDVPVVPGEPQQSTLERFYQRLIEGSGVDSRVGAELLQKWKAQALAQGGKFLAADSRQGISDTEFAANQNAQDSSFRIRFDRATSPAMFQELEEALRTNAAQVQPGTEPGSPYAQAREAQSKSDLTHPYSSAVERGVQTSAASILGDLGTLTQTPSQVAGLGSNAFQDASQQTLEALETRRQNTLGTFERSRGAEGYDPYSRGQKALESFAGLPLELGKLYATGGLGEAQFASLGALGGGVPGALEGLGMQKLFGKLGGLEEAGMIGRGVHRLGQWAIPTVQGIAHGEDPLTAGLQALPYAALPMGERDRDPYSNEGVRGDSRFLPEYLAGEGTKVSREFLQTAQVGGKLRLARQGLEGKGLEIEPQTRRVYQEGKPTDWIMDARGLREVAMPKEERRTYDLTEQIMESVRQELEGKAGKRPKVESPLPEAEDFQDREPGEKWQDMVDAARERRRGAAGGSTLGAGQQLVQQAWDYAIIGAEHLRQGYKKFEEWAPRMLQEGRLMGEDLSGKLKEFWERSKNLLPGELEKKTKVLGPRGKLLDVFHGTEQKFGEFDSQRSSPLNLLGDGFNFTNEPTIASGYSEANAVRTGNPNVRPAYLDIRDPLDLRSPKALDDLAARATKALSDPEALARLTQLHQVHDSWWHEEDSQQELQALVDAARQAKAQGVAFERLLWPNRSIDVEPSYMRQIAEGLGYDGIFHTGGEMVGDVGMAGPRNYGVYIAFRPEQIIPREYLRGFQASLDAKLPAEKEAPSRFTDPEGYRYTYQNYRENAIKLLDPVLQGDKAAGGLHANGAFGDFPYDKTALKEVYRSVREEAEARGLKIRFATSKEGPLTFHDLHVYSPEKVGEILDRNGLQEDPNKFIARSSAQTFEPGSRERAAIDEVYQAKEPKYVAEARKRLQEARYYSNPLDGWKDLALTTAYDLYHGARTFGSWAKDMVERLGEEVRPYLDTLWKTVSGELEDDPMRHPKDKRKGPVLDPFTKSVSNDANKLVSDAMDSGLKRGPELEDSVMELLRERHPKFSDDDLLFSYYAALSTEESYRIPGRLEEEMGRARQELEGTGPFAGNSFFDENLHTSDHEGSNALWNDLQEGEEEAADREMRTTGFEETVGDLYGPGQEDPYEKVLKRLGEISARFDELDGQGVGEDSPEVAELVQEWKQLKAYADEHASEHGVPTLDMESGELLENPLQTLDSDEDKPERNPYLHLNEKGESNWEAFAGEDRLMFRHKETGKEVDSEGRRQLETEWHHNKYGKPGPEDWNWTPEKPNKLDAIDFGEAGSNPNALSEDGEVSRAFQDRVDEDVRRMLEEGGGTEERHAGFPMAKALKEFRQVFNPTALGAEAPNAARLLRQVEGVCKADMLRMEVATKLLRKYFDSRPLPDNLDFIHKMETGNTGAMTPEEQGAATVFRDALDTVRNAIQQLGSNYLQSYYQDYFPHMYKDFQKAKDFFGKRPIEGPKKFLRQRTYDYFQDALNAGLEPLSSNPVDYVLLKRAEMQRFLLARLALRQAQTGGWARYYKNDQRNLIPSGWIKIDDPIATVKTHIPDVGLVERGGYWMAPEAAQVFNNYLGRGYSGKSWYDGWRAVNNNLTMAKLSLSAFHATATTINSISSAFGIGLKQALTPSQVLRGLSKMALSPLSPIRDLYVGGLVKKEYLNPGTRGDVVFQQAVDSLMHGNMAFRLDSAYKPDLQKALKETLAESSEAFQQGEYWKYAGKEAKGTMQAIFAMVEKTAWPLMEFMVPRMKLAAGLDMARYEIRNGARKGRSPAEIQSRINNAIDRTDDRFGQLVYDNFFMNKKTKDILQSSFLSAGWNLGTLREIGGAAYDTLKAPVDLARGQKPELTHRMAYTIALHVVAGSLGAALHKAYTGRWPGQNENEKNLQGREWVKQALFDTYFPRTGKTNKKTNTPDRITMPTYIKEEAALIGSGDLNGLNQITNIAHMIGDKLTPTLQATKDIILNEDYFGDPIRDKDADTSTQLGQLGKFIGKQLLPFSISGSQKATERGSSQLGAFLGFNPAPRWLLESKTQKFIKIPVKEKKGISLHDVPGAKLPPMPRHLPKIRLVKPEPTP